MKFTPIDYKVLLPVLLMSLASLVLAFVPVREAKEITAERADSVVEDSVLYDEIDYYEQVAEEFMAMLPSDKKVIAKLIDGTNHHVVYYETTECPSCYCYDLESQTTSVLFGSEDGFYIDTKLMILGSVIECRRVGDRAIFIATNRAPEASYENAVHVFELNLVDHTMKYIATGASASFK